MAASASRPAPHITLDTRHILRNRGSACHSASQSCTVYIFLPSSRGRANHSASMVRTARQLNVDWPITRHDHVDFAISARKGQAGSRVTVRHPRRRAARQGCVVAQPDRHAWPPGAGRRAPLTRSAPAFASGRGRASAQVVSRSGNDGLKNTRYLVRLSVPRAGGWRAWERLRRVRAPARRACVL